MYVHINSSDPLLLTFVVCKAGQEETPRAEHQNHTQVPGIYRNRFLLLLLGMPFRVGGSHENPRSAADNTPGH